MPIKSVIIDPGTGKQAAVVDSEEKNALVVATRPLKTYSIKVKFASNPNYGYNMNVAGGFGGTPEHVHNGTDNIYWTASSIVGTWVFNSTTQAHTGTKSIDATSTSNSDIAQIVRGSMISLINRVAITGWLYVSNWNDKDIKRIDVFGWDTTTSLMVGNAVNLREYTDVGLIGSWQKFVLPLSSMDLVDETIDAIRIETIDIGAGNPPSYYLDDIQIEETSNNIEFDIVPDYNTWLYVNDINIYLVGACTTTLTDATMPYLSYDKFLGVESLSGGILYKGVTGGKTRFTIPFKNISDFLMFPRARIDGYGSDGTNTFLKICIDLEYSFPLQAENGDKISFTVTDDLSGLLKLIISSNCKEELR